MTAYYNENNEYAASQLRSLIGRGKIASGEVDTRSIRSVQPDDLRGFTQCHFFAGIGVWSHALRLARWADDREVWTGSPPCQPYSLAGKQKAQTDDRHLWPELWRLARVCRPASIFGEQVANAIGHGWLDDVSNDVEAEGYSIGASVLRACSVGAPHERRRLFFCAKDVGHADSIQHTQREVQPTREERETVTGTGLWAGEWRECADGKWRLFAPGVPLLADGPLSRLAGPITAYGNAIVPQVAATFIEACS